MTYNLKFYLIIFLSLILSSSLFAIENKIALKIDTDIVTVHDIHKYSEYLELLNPKFIELSKGEKFEISKKSIINQKIKELEINDKFEKIEVDSDYLENLIKSIYLRANFKTLEEFENYLISKKINIKDIKKNLIIEALWNQFIFIKYSSKVKIDEKSIRNEFENKTKKNTFYNLSEIVFNVKKSSDFEKKYQSILVSIKNNGFENTASNFSISDTAINGGNIGWINEKALNKNLNKNISKLKIHDFTNPIKIPSGFIILKLNDKKEESVKIDLEKEIKKIVSLKQNNQLNQYSNIHLQKITRDTLINEL